MMMQFQVREIVKETGYYAVLFGFEDDLAIAPQVAEWNAHLTSRNQVVNEDYLIEVFSRSFSAKKRELVVLFKDKMEASLFMLFTEGGQAISPD